MSQIVYSNCSTISIDGCSLFTDSSLNTPVSNGKYSDGTNCYTVSGGFGEVTAIENCSTPTPTPTPITPTPTPTPVPPTPTPTPSTFNVDIHARLYVTDGSRSVTLDYSLDDGASWTDTNISVNNTNCDYYITINVSGGIKFRMREVSTSDIYQHSRANLTTICPSDMTGSACETAVININSNRSYSFTCDITGISC